MPTKNPIELGAGTFYMKPLEGGDPVPLGEGQEVEEVNPEAPDALHTMRGTHEASFTLEMEPDEVWENIQELFIKPVAKLCREWIEKLAATYCAWCMENHPDWVRILRRTKKKRTRKKYHDRLRRAFLEEVNHGKA